MKQQRSIKDLFSSNPNPLDFITKNSLPAKTENLLHGKVINSIESNELPKSSMDESDSKQIELPIKPVGKIPIPPANDVNAYRPEDYLPSYEYFPRTPQHSSYNQRHPQEPSVSKYQTIEIGPNSFKSTPFYNELSNIEIEVPRKPFPSLDKNTKIASSVIPSSGCHCDAEQFNDLLHHMQSSYQKFHNGMIQLFDTFKSQSNCGSKPVLRDHDSSGSPSYSNFDYRVDCRDKNQVAESDRLTQLCQGSFDDDVNPSSGYYEPPGEHIPTGGYENQFLSYQDYVKMMRNVNLNSGTLLSSSYDLDDQILGAAPRNQGEEDRETQMKQLKEHIKQFKMPEKTLVEDPPIVAVSQEVAQPKLPKLDMKALDMKAFFENLRIRN